MNKLVFLLKYHRLPKGITLAELCEFLYNARSEKLLENYP